MASSNALPAGHRGTVNGKNSAARTSTRNECNGSGSGSTARVARAASVNGNGNARAKTTLTPEEERSVLGTLEALQKLAQNKENIVNQTIDKYIYAVWKSYSSFREVNNEWKPVVPPVFLLENKTLAETAKHNMYTMPSNRTGFLQDVAARMQRMATVTDYIRTNLSQTTGRSAAAYEYFSLTHIAVKQMLCELDEALVKLNKPPSTAVDGFTLPEDTDLVVQYTVLREFRQLMRYTIEGIDYVKVATEAKMM